MSDIAFTSDILEEVAKEKGESIDVVRYAYDLFLESLKKGILEDKATVVRIPNIGNLYLKTGHLKHKIRNGQSWIKEVYGEQIKKTDRHFREIRRKRGLSIVRNYHVKRKALYNKGNKADMTFSEMEDLQNNQ